MLIVVPVQTALALLLAFLVNQRFLRARGSFRTLLYFPSVTSAIAITLIWLVLFRTSGLVNRILPIDDIKWFDEPNGVIHNLLGVFGVDNAPSWLQGEVFELSLWQWLSGPSVAMVAIMLMTIWTTSGTMMLIFLGGLQNISQEIEEAAAIDGASWFQRFRLVDRSDAPSTGLPRRHAWCHRDVAGVRPDLRIQRRRPTKDDADARLPDLRPGLHQQQGGLGCRHGGAAVRHHPDLHVAAAPRHRNLRGEVVSPRSGLRDPLSPPRAMQRTIYIALLIAGAFYLLPFLLAVVTSFKSQPDFAANASSLLFDRALGSPTLDGLRGLASDRITFWRWAFNSVLVTVCVVIGRVMLAALAGYSLARIRFPGYRLVFGLILAVMMVPPIILAIPRFLLLKELGLLNTYPGLIVPLVFDAFGIFLMKQFMEQIPVEIEEAAAIDGAGRVGTFLYVVLPNARPAIITLTILATVGTWNEFIHPLIATNENDLRTLPVGLAQIRGQFGEATPWNTVMMATVLLTIPMAIIYFVFQRYFRQGLSGAVKG